MNYLQFMLFGVYIFSVLSCGLALLRMLDEKKDNFKNMSLHVGEAFLLGSIFVIGEMVLLSLLGLYKAFFLWGLILLQYGFLLGPKIREDMKQVFKSVSSWNLPKIIFVCLLAFFMFRNLYFLVDVDSHSSYLFAQKLWLEDGGSLIGNVGRDMRVYVPHFNAVPYALGISLFGQETLFPQLVVAFWTVITVLIVYGYTSFRFNGYYGLAASMLVLFNDHMFYSGANKCCIINSALIAFLFAAAYNFWEGRGKDGAYRFLLALIFLSQLMANKYQMVYVTLIILVFSFIIQPDLFEKIKTVLKKRVWVMISVASVFFALLWYIKNFFATGCPTFPIFAGALDALNWTPDRQMAFLKGCGELSLMKYIKYMTYFFVWPGVNASKYVVMIVAFFPLIILGGLLRSEINKSALKELCYWLGLSLLCTMGICLTNYTDPRVYRYAIAVLAFTAVFSFDYILRYCFLIRRKMILAGIIVLLAIPGYKIMFFQGGSLKRPTFEDNVNVLFDRLHMDEMVRRYYPNNIVANEGVNQHSEESKDGAWDTGVGGVTPLSAFLLPTKPQLDLWHTSIVKWDSYEDRKLIVRDLEDYGIRWVMRVEDGQFKLSKPEDYAQKANQYERYPKTTFYNYGFPKELSEVKY